MLTLLIIAIVAKFAHSTHSDKPMRCNDVGECILETPFGQEYIRVIKHKPKHSVCNSDWKNIQNEVSCKPRDRIIPLGNDFIPNAINVKRCSGTCRHGTSFIYRNCPGVCGASERRNITVKANRLESGKKICVEITVQEDVACSCMSRTETICPHEKFWDKKTCNCICLHKPCTTGTVLDKETCKCVRKPVLRQ